MGKTNVLDAIYAICTGRCYFNRSDRFNIQEGKEYAVIQGDIRKSGESQNVILGMRSGAAKTIRIDQGKNIRITEYLGRFPAILICPGDISLINGRSEDRRKFLDSIISQSDSEYLRHLVTYTKLLEMRNRQLKQFAVSGKFDPMLLESIDQQMIEPATKVHEGRTEFLEEFVPFFVETYQRISGGVEEPRIDYQSDLNEQSMAIVLEAQHEKDRILERTSKGVHKDDLLFSLGEFPIKTYGSQGQIKSFVIALKLASYQYLKKQTGTKPILLLDDIFEKIDSGRAAQLLQMIATEEFGQVFITDTENERVHKALDKYSSDVADLVLS